MTVCINVRASTSFSVAFSCLAGSAFASVARLSRAILPELGVGTESQVFLFDKGALRVALCQEGEQLR